MIFGFYHRFFKYTHLKRLSIAAAYITRFCFFVLFLIKRLFLRKETSSMQAEEAFDRIRNVSPEPQGCISYKMTSVDKKIDLSIIIPVYNHIHEVPKCIESCLKQNTRYQYELILVDDGSTDGIQNKIDQYTLLPDVRIVHQKNMGIAGARNSGIELARGRYIMFVDCDDTVHNNIVEVLMSRAYLGDYDIVMGAHTLVKKKENVVLNTVPIILPDVNLRGYRNGDEIMNYDGLPWGKVYKRELFQEVRFFTGYWYEDTIVHMLLFTQCGRFCYEPTLVYDYVFTEKSFSHTQVSKKSPPAKSMDRYWLLEAIAKRYMELGLPKNAVFYTALLEHVSAYYFPTIENMPDEIVEAMFVAGRELLLKYRPRDQIKLPFMLQLTEKAIIENNIALWKLCSVNQ